MYAERQNKSTMSRTIDRSPRQLRPVQRLICYECNIKGGWSKQKMVEDYLNKMPNVEMFRQGNLHLHVFFEHSQESTKAYTQNFINDAEVTVELHLNIRTLLSENDIKTTIFHEWTAHIMSLNTLAQILSAQKGREYSEPSEIELLEHTAYAFGGDAISQAIPKNSPRALLDAITKDRKTYEREVGTGYNDLVAERLFFDKLFGRPLAYILELDERMAESIQDSGCKVPLSMGEINKRILNKKYPTFNDFASDVIDSFRCWESYFEVAKDEVGLAIIRYLLTMANKYKIDFAPKKSLEAWSSKYHKQLDELIKLLGDGPKILVTFLSLSLVL